MANRIISRAQAKAQGLRHYFTGKPCLRGHIDKRATQSKKCLSCHRERRAVVRATQAEVVKAQKAASYKRHRDAVIASVTAYTEANREKVYLRRKKHREANRERLAAEYAVWAQANRPLLRVHERRRRDRERGATGSHTYADIQAIGRQQGWLCAAPWCRAAIASAFHIDHVLPIVRGGTNDRSNIQLLCGPCNLSKGDAHPDDWLRRPAPPRTGGWRS